MSHGKVVKIANANELAKMAIKRDNYLNPALVKQIAQKIASKQDLLFLGNDVAESFKKDVYVLTIHGILPCGSKTTLSIQGIEPYVVIKLDADESEDQARTKVYGMINARDDALANPTKIVFKTGKDFLYFAHESSAYAHVHFQTLKARGAFITTCENRKIKTYSNDRGTYYRVVARDYEINLSGWSVLRGYSKSNASTSKAKYCLDVHVDGVRSICDDDELVKLAKKDSIQYANIKYENMIVAAYDIEMIPAKAGCFPDADKNPRDSIFMICITYHFVKRPEAILSVCLTLKPSDPIDDMLVVHCASEPCLIESFSKIMSLMQPDFITEFNGGGFDWRNVITKARIYNIIPQFLNNFSIVQLDSWEIRPDMLSRYHNNKDIKIGGGAPPSKCKGLKMQGSVVFDTLIVMKQLEPLAESHKLNECLRRRNLGCKDELEIPEMFRLYKEGTLGGMSKVAHYCYIDTFKLQQLLIKESVVQDRREVAMLSYTSIQDNFYFAGGSRMRNLLMNRGSKLGHFFDTRYKPVVEDPDAKFPGAYVVPPIKGIVKPMLRLDEFMQTKSIELTPTEYAEGYQYIDDRYEGTEREAPEFMKSYIEYTEKNPNQYPASGLDFASLYPSNIMAYNISPDKLVVDEKYAKKLEAQGYTIKHVSFPYCGKTVNAWFVRHDNNPENYSVCGQLLIELGNRRAELKKQLKRINETRAPLKEELKQYKGREDKYPRIDELNEINFDYGACDSKQKAVKVFMNTLYGEMGNTHSCICEIAVAGSVTTMGRYNIKLMKAYVENELGMNVKYGDTDSLYVECNPSHFTAYDREYFTGKIDKIAYGTKLVEKTFIEIEKAKNKVNRKLIEDNGSEFLKMAYEEVLYPAIFFGKKKYCGIQHEDKVDFFPTELSDYFIRGLELKKRGASEVMKDISSNVLRQMLDINNLREPIDLIKEAASRFFSTNWSIDEFVKSKTYNPEKDNKSVITMRNRYIEMNYHTVPEPGLRFKYVVCKYFPWTYDIRGVQTKCSIGDCMELVERVKEEGLEIDLEYYFDNELTGQLARLITFCDEVKEIASEPVEIDTQDPVLAKEIYTKNEEALFKAAKKLIAQYAKHYSNAYTNKGSLFASTWRAVGVEIRKKPMMHMSVLDGVITNIFANTTGVIEQDLFSWATRHIANHYGVIVKGNQATTLKNRLDRIARFVRTKDLAPMLADYMDTWKRNVVMHIREEYAYDLICKHNHPIKTVWDVMDQAEMELIIAKRELAPTINQKVAMKLIGHIVSAITTTLTTEQLSS